MTERNWRLDAACRDADPELFFPLKKTDPRRKEALRLCAECPVTRECGEFAFTADVPYGIWGGKTAKKRSNERGGPRPRATTIPLIARQVRRTA